MNFKHRFANTSQMISVLMYAVVGLLLVLVFDSKDIVLDANLLISIDPNKALSMFSNSWNSTFGFGQSFNWSSAYLFPYITLKLLFSDVIGNRLGQSVFLALPLLLGIGGVHFLLRTLFNNPATQSSNPLSKLVDPLYFLAGIYYVSNIYFILVYVGASSLTYTHIMLPFQIGLMIRILSKSSISVKNTLYFAFATLIMSGTSPPYIIISFIILMYVILVLLVINVKRTPPIPFTLQLRKLFLLIFVTVALNAIWILPLSTHFMTINSSDLSAALIETPQMHNSRTTYLNVLRNMGLWSFGGSYQGREFYSYAKYYLYNSFSQYLFFAGTGFVIFALMIKRSKKWIFVLIPFVIFLPLVVGINQGLFTRPYQWMYDNVPGFVIFRGSYKFVGVLVLIQSLSIGLIAHSIRHRKTALVIFGTLLTCLVFLNGAPIWKKSIIDESKIIHEIPSYYHEADLYFRQDNEGYRLWLLPDQYLADYEWANTGANVEVLWGKPLVNRLANSQVHPMNIAVNQLTQSLKTNDMVKMQNLLEQYNVKYIVVREDTVWNAYPELKIKESQIYSRLSRYPYVQIGRLRIYQDPMFIDRRISGKALLSYDATSPVLYKLRLKCGAEWAQTEVSFNETKDAGWHLYGGGHSEEQETYQNWIHQQVIYLQYLFKAPLSLVADTTADGAFNKWHVDTSSLPCQEGSKRVDLYYQPQIALSLGMTISLLSVLIMVVIVIKLMLGSRR